MDTAQKSTLEAFLDSTQAYSKTTLELTKLKGLKATTVILFAVILSIGAALWMSDQLGKPYYGFFILSAIYLLIVLVVYFFLHRWLDKPFSNLIITQALD